MARGEHLENIDKLRMEDRILWDAVRRTAVPLRGKRQITSITENASNNAFLLEIDRKPLNKVSVAAKKNLATRSLPSSSSLHPLDRPTHRKISRGRIQIEGRVDLHGLFQDKAYSLLLHFLQSARYRGLRHVLVITGKGTSPGSEGILRQLVPHWLATPPFRQLVTSFDDAARHHGGGGALYVRLRRNIAG